MRSYAAEKEKPLPLAELPVKIIDNRIVINVPVAHYQLNLVLDTGASSTALFQTEEYDFKDFIVAGKSSIIFPALDTVVNGIKLKPQPILLQNQPFIPAKLLLIKKDTQVGDRLDFRFDGIIGQDFFTKFVVEIEPDKKILRLYDSKINLSPYFRTNIELHMKGLSPHIQFKSKLPWEDFAMIKSMMLDTGYPGAMVIWSTNHFLKAARGSNSARLKLENKGIFTYADFKVDRIKFIKTPIFISPNEPIQAHKRDGLIGANILVQFHHVLDFPNNRLLLDINRRAYLTQIDGHIYLPNDEGFIVKNYEKHEAGSISIIKQK